MKALIQHKLDPIKARQQWNDFRILLQSKNILKERQDILPFFAARRDLSILTSYYIAGIRNADVIAHEFPLGGDFVVDLLVGDSTTHQYLLIEFENAASDSLFKGKKAKRDWSPRLEGAFSQLIDWLWKLDDLRSTNDFVHTFGHRDAKFLGIIVIGKNSSLSDSEKSRLIWRKSKTIVDSTTVGIVHFDGDGLEGDYDYWLSSYHQV